MHGNAKKKEKSPDGGPDQNVFDIQQGVAIGIFVKKQLSEADASTSGSKVYHADLFGHREVVDRSRSDRKIVGGKYAFLRSNDLISTNWTELKPQTPSYLFIPQDSRLADEYMKFWAVTEMFEVFASTVTTARNDFSMAHDSQSLMKRINDLRDQSIPNDSLRERYLLKDVSYWNLATARTELGKITEVKEFVRPYCYRPFDFRYVYYHDAVCERLRKEVMSHMAADNLAFLTHRPQSPGEFTFAYCTRMIGDQCVAANKTAGGGNSFQFPLYVYPTEQERDMGSQNRYANLSDRFTAGLNDWLGLRLVVDGKGDLENTVGPEDVFAYTYAVFHSPAYRSRYAEFLKIDFPRLPLTSNVELFRELVRLGDELVKTHLLERELPEIAVYPIDGDNVVEKPTHRDGRVWINSKQYFDNVPADVWKFHIGGYQVCHKWLKDRKGRTLTYDDLIHYKRIVAALAETIRLMAEIDTAIASHGGFPLR